MSRNTNQLDELWIQDEAEHRAQVAIHKVNHKKSIRAKTSFRNNFKKLIKKAISKGLRFKYLSAPKVFSMHRTKNSDTLVEVEDISELVVREEGDQRLEKRLASFVIALLVWAAVFMCIGLYKIITSK